MSTIWSDSGFSSLSRSHTTISLDNLSLPESLKSRLSRLTVGPEKSKPSAEATVAAAISSVDENDTNNSAREADVADAEDIEEAAATTKIGCAGRERRGSGSSLSSLLSSHSSSSSSSYDVSCLDTDDNEDTVEDVDESNKRRCQSRAEEEGEVQREEDEAVAADQDTAPVGIATPYCKSGDNCACKRLKAWLKKQGNRDLAIIENDVYFLSQKEMEPKTPSTKTTTTLCNFEPYPSIVLESFRYAGKRDRLGRLNDKGNVYFANGRKFVGTFDSGLRHGPGELFDREGTRILSGHYCRDQLHGVAEVATNDGGVLELVFRRGVPHGPARRFSPEGRLQWLGRYREGQPNGLCWHSKDNEGWYVGPTNRYGRLSGPNVVYLYPDLHTALVGKWVNDCMDQASEARLVGLTEMEGYLYPLLTEPDKEGPCYTMDVSGYEVISKEPRLPDPYEDALCQCRDSGVDGGGQGLYARRNIPPDTVVSFYNGVRFHDCHAFNDWDYNSYKIRLNEKKKQILDIPPEFRAHENYSATLAHKVNHSFFPNARFSDYAHPRFGRILCVKTTKTVATGEELFCNYGYSLADCPLWYKQLHEALFFDKRATIMPSPPPASVSSSSSSTDSREH